MLNAGEKIVFRAREAYVLDHVLDHRLAVKGDKRLGLFVSGGGEARAGTGHGNNDVHAASSMIRFLVSCGNKFRLTSWGPTTLITSKGSAAQAARMPTGESSTMIVSS